MAVNSTAGVLAACKTVLTTTSDRPLISGSLSSGLHHASTGQGSDTARSMVSLSLQITSITVK